MKILALTDKALKEQHDKILEGDFDYGEMVTKLLQQCKAFEGARVIPSVMKRGKKGKETKYLEIWVSVLQSKLRPGDGKPRDFSWTGEKKMVIHRRIIKGTPKEMAEMALKIIRETKKAAEVFTVLEETCQDSEEV